MTERERQILKWIEENPMISQRELADRAGITRSSVAVHISNLMKKGYISGKGYVLRSDSYAVVVGGVNMDIGGRSHAPLVAGDSNPGEVTMSVGGVGRNIAHNMSLLGLDTRMLSAIGDDLWGNKISAACTACGMDFSHVKRVSGAATSTYLYLSGPDGDMALAVNDMDICREISPEYLEKNLALLSGARVVVLDANIPEKSIAFLAEYVSAPIFADPVSVAKIEKLRPVLGRIHTLKPNRGEAERMSGVTIRNQGDLERAACVLLETGLKRVFISLGTEGVFAADHEKTLNIANFKAAVRNTTGAGDAFMAALVWAYFHKSDLETSAKAGAAAAAIAVEGEGTINEDLTRQALLERINMEKG